MSLPTTRFLVRRWQLVVFVVLSMERRTIHSGRIRLFPTLGPLGARWICRRMVLHSQHAFFDIPIPKPQTEAPVGSFEGHLSRDFTNRRLWVSLDGNFWVGGITSLNGIRNLESKQTGSRIGGTFSVPVSKHQSLKFSYSNGTYIRFGRNYQNVSVAWQYSWLGKPN